MRNETPSSSAAPFTVRLDDTTIKALDQLAEQTDRSRNWLVSRAVEDYVALNAWQLKKILKGISAADRGEFASDEEMARTWKKYAPK